MIRNTLDADNKPMVVTGSGYHLNQGIRFWFRNSSDLNSYNMAAPAHNENGRGYLTPFRPIYIYQNNSNSFNVPPPAVREATSNMVNNGLRATNGGWQHGSTTHRWYGNAYANTAFVPARPLEGGTTIAVDGNNVAISGSNRDVTHTINNAFENRVIPATLNFRLIDAANGRYEFWHDDFFPMRESWRNSNNSAAGTNSDRRRGYVTGLPTGTWPGFNTGTGANGGKWASHNTNDQNVVAQGFGFTMELAVSFRMQPGAEFVFSGDDDVWVFINGNLALDLGGVKEREPGSIWLEDWIPRDATGLQELRMFYAERHSTGSTIRITTNLAIERPGGIDIIVAGDTMTAGVPEPATAEVVLETGSILTNYTGGNFRWGAFDVNGYNTVQNGHLTINTNTGRPDSITVTANIAYTTIRIWGTYTDSTGYWVTDTADVWVKPGPAARLQIENSQDSASILRDPNFQRHLTQITIPATQDSVQNFFAIVRDAFGNWVGRADVAGGSTHHWVVEDESIARVTPAGTAPPRTEGRAIRVAAFGETPLRVRNATNTIVSPPTIITIANITYDGIRIVVWNGTEYVPVTEVRMPAGTDTTLWVELQRRTDGGAGSWVRTEPVSWSSVGVPGLPQTHPGMHVSWGITPTGPTSGTGGRVTATRGSLTAFVTIIVDARDPDGMRFYNRRGAPATPATPISQYILPEPFPAAVRPYVVPQASVTLTAGASLPIVAKMFTSATVFNADTWLEALENPMADRAGWWTWSFVPGSNTTRATLSATNGDSIMFRSTAATYSASEFYQVRAVFNNGSGIIRQADILIRVVPRLVDDPNPRPDDPNPPDPDNPTATRTVRLVIEPNDRGLTESPNSPQRMPEIVIQGEDLNQRPAFAVLRDPYGNYITPSGSPIPSGYLAAGGDNTTGPTVWTPANDAGQAIIVASGRTALGEGLVNRRDPTGTVPPIPMIAFDQRFNVRDTAWVRLLGYGYDTVRIVITCPDGREPEIDGRCFVRGDTLVITTDDLDTMFTYGRRDDCAAGATHTEGGEPCWERVQVDWDRDGGLVISFPNPPKGDDMWPLTPRGPGDGWIRITDRDGRTDSVWVVVTAGPPTRAEIRILTPADSIIAGYPIRAEITYYNSTGIINEWNPNWTNGPSIFRDTLGMGSPNVTTKPTVNSCFLTGQDLRHAELPGLWGESNAQLCPANPNTARDTVTFFIYYAADNHQIRFNETLTIGGTNRDITALSDRFNVKPGDPHTIRIEPTGPCVTMVGDTITLDRGIGCSTSDALLRVISYDEFGNRIGEHPSNWATIGEPSSPGIPVITANGRALVIYPSQMGELTENGTISFAVNGGNNRLGVPMTDGKVIKIIGVTTWSISATTRDYTGCGYLSAIELRFPRKVELTEIASGNNNRQWLMGHIDIRNSGTRLVVDSVTINPSDSTMVILWLAEDHQNNSAPLQVGWTPLITEFSENVLFEAGVDVGRGDGYRCIDGAAPVIWTARLFFPRNNTGNIAEQYIEVEFPEAIRSSNDLPFWDDLGSFRPEQLFMIWERRDHQQARRPLFRSRARTRSMARVMHDFNEGQEFIELTDQLNGIVMVHRGERPNTLRFFLENGGELTPGRHFINIKANDAAAPTAHIWDNATPRNIPLENNRKVPITYGNEPGGNGRAIPNPASPDDRRVPAGVIEAIHDRNAIRDIENGSGGTVFQVPIYVPDDPAAVMMAQIKVYDLAGNLVNSGQSNQVRQSLLEDNYATPGNFAALDLYWNGYNERGMIVAPGTYRMVVHITYRLSANASQQDRQHAKSRRFTGVLGISK
jgi:fibro-slime domain-containing protein